MMTARLDVVVPRIRFAACHMLSRHPPAAHLLVCLRLDEVEDHHDVAHKAIRSRRDVGVATIELEAMYAAAFAADAPFVHELRRRWIRDVEDAEAAAELRRTF